MASFPSLGPVSSGNSINIRRDVQDAFYRYKMPRLQSKLEGKGNGIKTVIPNMVDIAKALHRPPAYITKFFGAELGALSNCDEKAAKYIVNGAHDADKLQNLLDGFIQKFVLCPNCENPETLLSVSKKDGTIYRTCQACGHRAAVDMMHKLISFIRANPPPKPLKKSQARDQVHANDEIASSMALRASSPLATGDGHLGPEETIDGMIAPDNFDEGLDSVAVRADDDDWDEEAAAAQRRDELAHLSESVRQKLSLAKSKPEDDLMDSLDVFGDFLEANPDLDNGEIIDEIEDRNIRSDKAIAVLIQILFVEDFMKAFKARLPLLERLVTTEKDQIALLGSVERLVGVVNPSLMSKIPVILQLLYNHEFVEEEALAAWKEKPSKRYVSKEIGARVRVAAAPFFEWLSQEEDEESDGNE